MAGTMDAATVAARWASRLAGSTDKMRQGVQAVTVAPSQQAAAAASTWQARVSSPEALAKFQSSLQRVSLQDWQNAMINKGIARVATGAANATSKMQSFLTQFLPFVNNVAAQVRQMPNATLEDRINRAVTQMRNTASFKRSA